MGFFFFFFNLCSLELFVIYLKIFVCLCFSASHLETPLPSITLNSHRLVIGIQDGYIQM